MLSDSEVMAHNSTAIRQDEFLEKFRNHTSAITFDSDFNKIRIGVC